jgi:DNA repair protein RecO (recombination protein O)
VPRTGRTQRVRVRSEALLVRRVPYAESDVVVGLFTRERGLASALARGARRSARRFPALEPMHLLRVTFEESAMSELGTLVEAEIATPRLALTGDLDRLEAAGMALRWVRRAAPPHTPEPGLWREINALLDALNVPALAAPPRTLLAETGLRLLAEIGWGLDLERCVVCGKACQPGSAAVVDAARGGLVCRSCGGGSTVLRGERRRRLAEVAAGTSLTPLDERDAVVALELVEAALSAHAGVEA